MDVVIRRAVAGEAADAGEHTALVKDALTTGRCMVAVSGTDVVGYSVFTPGRFFGRLFVDLLVVSPAARRRGVGRALLRAAVAGTVGDSVWTSTNESNAPMRALLESEGWEFSGALTGLDENDPELFFFLVL